MTLMLAPPSRVIVPLRRPPPFAEKIRLACPLPVPAGLAIVIHLTLLHATQLHDGALVVTVAADTEAPEATPTGPASPALQPGCAACAMTIPAPESRSTPGASMSIADAMSADRVCAGVNDGFADLMSAAIAAACGAAACPPHRTGGMNPPAPLTDTLSAAVKSGFCRTVPPVEDRFPGVIAAPSCVKKMRRGPSELVDSTGRPLLKGPG